VKSAGAIGEAPEDPGHVAKAINPFANSAGRGAEEQRDRSLDRITGSRGTERRNVLFDKTFAVLQTCFALRFIQYQSLGLKSGEV
jgi:hypothetical protein